MVIAAPGYTSYLRESANILGEAVRLLDAIIEYKSAVPSDWRAERIRQGAVQTSWDEERDRLASYENGANGLVRKPLDFAEHVAQVGIYWMAVTAPPRE